ncbi:hypothetical protein BDZ89DRAFT_1144555 [Hymenopellis radicata]|nr:hypothetical protein BDZ89DRAFT_1144555 [Hymenopellis radicata]
MSKPSTYIPKTLEEVWHLYDHDDEASRESVKIVRGGHSFTYEPGYDIFTTCAEWNELMARDEDASYPHRRAAAWKAHITGIRSTAGGLIFQVHWFYNLEQAYLGIQRLATKQQLERLEKVTGRFELFLSDHVGYIDAACILDEAAICWVTGDDGSKKYELAPGKGKSQWTLEDYYCRSTLTSVPLGKRNMFVSPSDQEQYPYLSSNAAWKLTYQ